MKSLRDCCRQLATNKWFEYSIVAVIIINALLIGVETYYTNATIAWVQEVILWIFTFEIAVRFVARKSLKEFFSSGWNNFDLFLVLICYIPESLFENASTLMVLRVLRVFRVLRLLRSSGEVRLIISVMIKSMSALFYNAIFFLIFLYLFAIIGHTLFKLPDPATLSGENLAAYEQMMQEAPHSPGCSPDPYGTLGESMFTLFRSLTGEDWTDLRYNLVYASEHGIVGMSPALVTIFHVLWYVFAACLLLNLVVGAVINNYQIIMDEDRARRAEEKRLQEEQKAGHHAGKDH